SLCWRSWSSCWWSRPCARIDESDGEETSMLAYVIRRSLYGVLTVLGVLLLLFVLFFFVTAPEDIARRALGEKAPPEAIHHWSQNHGYDRPWPQMLVDHYRRMLTFDFGNSDADDVPIARRLREGAGPSLTLMLPLFLLGIPIAVSLSLLVAFFRE